MKKLLGILVIFGVGIVFTIGFSAALDYTNTTEFCTSCHSMSINLKEMKENVHYKNASGVTAGCSDCHVPKPLIPKLWAKVMAAKDVYHHLMGTIDTQEKFEERRWKMANVVWEKMRASNSRECRSCHSFASMDFDEQDRSASKKHQKAVQEACTNEDNSCSSKDDKLCADEIKPCLDKNQDCIDCHKGIAHEEPEDPNDD
ncbi:MAG: NapC/NirT family cytochrome c [Thiomargarita sp.]|nr:NapC/NirT family cytochrome c [Thiomargarita sp.]